MYLPSLYDKPKVIFVVGAHTADPEQIAYCQETGAKLYMFEPLPERFEALQKRVADIDHIQVFPLAISNYEDQAKFNVANHDDCSSLLSFDDQVNETWVHKWHPIDRFEMVDQIEVEVTRLDTFMAEHQVTQIDLIEIDAQGEDLRVVESLGDKIAQVKQIQLEVSIYHSPLYQNSCNKAEVVAHFAQHQFEKHASWKQTMGREENIIFRNKRFYPNPALNLLIGLREEVTRKVYYNTLRYSMITRRVFGVLTQKIFSPKKG